MNPEETAKEWSESKPQPLKTLSPERLEELRYKLMPTSNMDNSLEIKPNAIQEISTKNTEVPTVEKISRGIINKLQKPIRMRYRSRAEYEEALGFYHSRINRQIRPQEQETVIKSGSP